MKKRILVLGAGRGQVDLIRAVRKYGHTAIVASIPGNYPGLKCADEVCHADISDPAAVDRAVRECRADAVVTACLDTGIAALGYACENNRLPGLSTRAAQLSGDKLLMKAAFMEHGVSTARYMQVKTEAELKRAADTLRFPLIVKAVDLQGSKGIYIVHDLKQLYDGYAKTMSDTGKDFCIVEEFIEGYEFGAQAFVQNHEVVFVLPGGDITFLSGTNVPVGHYAPLQLDGRILEQIDQQVRLAIEAIGLNDCAVNVDMIMKDDTVYVIELSGRIGANCLPQLTSIYYGIDIYRMIIDAALGVDVKEYFETNRKAPTPCYAKMLISDKAGCVARIINSNDPNDPRIEEITLFVGEGSRLRRFENSRDCIGQVVVKGSSSEECERLIEEVTSHIGFVLE